MTAPAWRRQRGIGGRPPAAARGGWRTCEHIPLPGEPKIAASVESGDLIVIRWAAHRDHRLVTDAASTDSVEHPVVLSELLQPLWEREICPARAKVRRAPETTPSPREQHDP